jgi:hypothetical protein
MFKPLTLLKHLVQVGGLYLLWIIIHFGASALYLEWCVPQTMAGFLWSPFLAPMPHCRVLRWAIYEGGESINVMWLMISVFVARLLTAYK